MASLCWQRFAGTIVHGNVAELAKASLPVDAGENEATSQYSAASQSMDNGSTML
jgi:hypothetical protein